jgi:hypothetical protein
MNNRVVKCFLITIIAWSGLTVGNQAMAVEDFLEEMFLSTRTGAQTWESQTRRGATLGSFHARTPVSSINLFRINPPALRTGSCGGIDLHLGSFSHINMDEAVQIMREIGSNALAFLFQIALQKMSDMIANNIKTFVDRVEALNRHFRNTCQIGMMVAEAATGDLGPIKEWSGQIGQDLCAVVGGEDNRFCQENQDDDQVLENAAEIPTVGNLVHRMLSNEDVGGDNPRLVNQTRILFDNSSQPGQSVDEQTAREIIIAFVGTVMYCPEEGVEDQEATPFPINPTLDISDIFSGNVQTDSATEGGMRFEPVAIQACRGDVDLEDPLACCDMSNEKQVRFTSFVEKAREEIAFMNAAFETSGEGGLSTTEQERINRFLDSTSIPILRMQNNILEDNPAIRLNFDNLMADLIAEEWESRFLLSFRSIIQRLGSTAKIELPGKITDRVAFIEEQIEGRAQDAEDSLRRRNLVEELIANLNRAAIQWADSPAASLPAASGSAGN